MSKKITALKPAKTSAAKQANNKAHNKIPKELVAATKLFQKGDAQGAELACRALLRVNPRDEEAILLLGKIALSLGQLAQAKQLIEASIQLKPHLVEAHFNLGLLLESKGEMYPAMNAFRHCIELDPKHEAGPRLGKILNRFGYVTDAINLFTLLLKFDPKNTQYLVNLALAFNGAGQLQNALETLEQALAIEPNLPSGISNLLFLAHYKPDLTPEELFALHRTLAQRLCPTKPRSTKQSVRQLASARSNPKIRIGYVSADFHVHSVTDFFESLLAHHDRSKFEVYCYYNNDRIDQVTQRLMTASDHWISTLALPAPVLAQRIERDQLDILVDLSGHTGGNRLGVFALKPAPIQVTWLGYPNTTGLTQMDYRFTDDIADPIGAAEHLHTEQLVRLPGGFLCYRCNETPHLEKLPAHCRNDIFTFGSCNNISKVSPEVIAVWSNILQRVPNSRLLMKVHQFIDDRVKQRVQQRFEQHGITPDRLSLRANIEHRQAHMELYNQIDLALDTFPYNGTTTTCEATWMGVPTVTYAGRSHVARVGASILHRVGLDDFVAKDIEGYLTKAVEVATNPSVLESLKTQLRPRLQESDLGNGKRFAEQIEAAFMNMLQRLP